MILTFILVRRGELIVRQSMMVSIGRQGHEEDLLSNRGGRFDKPLHPSGTFINFYIGYLFNAAHKYDTHI